MNNTDLSSKSNKDSTLFSCLILGLPLILITLYFSIGFTFKVQGDNLNFIYPKLSVMKKMIEVGEWPLWNPYEGGGSPLLAEGAKPILESFLLYFLEAFDAMVLIGTLHFGLSLWFFFKFAQSLGLSSRGAFLGALLWSLNGYHLWYVYDLSLLGTNLFLPLILYVCLNFQKSRKKLFWLVLAGLSCGCQFLYGRPTDHIYCLIVVFFFCWHTMRLENQSRSSGTEFLAFKKTFLFCAVMTGLGILLSLFFILPYASYLGESMRFLEDFERTPTSYIKVTSWVEFFVPSLIRDVEQTFSWFPTFAGSQLESRGYFGVPMIPFLLAGLACRKHLYGFFFSLMAFLSFLLIFPFGFFDLLRLLPLHSGAVESIRWVPPLMFSLAVLVGIGYDSIFSFDDRKEENQSSFKKILIGFVGRNLKSAFLIFGLLSVCFLTTYMVIRGWMQLGWVYYFLISFCIFVLLRLFCRSKAHKEGDVLPKLFFTGLVLNFCIFLFGCLGILFFLTGNFLTEWVLFSIGLISVCFVHWWVKTRSDHPFIFGVFLVFWLVLIVLSNHTDDNDGETGVIVKNYFETQATTRALLKSLNSQTEESLYRVAGLGPWLKYSSTWLLHSMGTPSFYQPAPNGRMVLYFNELADENIRVRYDVSQFASFWHKMFNTRYFFWHDSQEDVPQHFVENKIESQEGICVSENSKVFPRFYFVSGHKVIESDNQAIEFMKAQAQLDSSWFAKNVVLSSKPESDFQFSSSSDKNQNQIFDIDYQQNHVELKAEVQEPAFLVFLDNYDPGWQAFVNDEPVNLFRANYLFRAIWLNEGMHHISFVYRPKGFDLGLWISGLSLLSCCFLLGYSCLTGKKG